MSNTNDPVRNALLGQIPDPKDLPAYRASVKRMVSEHEKRLRRERILAGIAWAFCAISATAWIWSAPPGPEWGRAPFLACIFMIIGAVEVLKYRINSVHVVLLAELKQIQMQIFDLEQGVTREVPGRNEG